MDEQSNLHPTVFIPNPLVSLVNGLDPFALGALATSRVGVGLQCVRFFFKRLGGGGNDACLLCSRWRERVDRG